MGSLRKSPKKKKRKEGNNTMKNVVVFLLVLGQTVIMAPVSARASSTKSEHLSKALTMLQPCERAIWSCCQVDRPQVYNLKSNCFELNGCYGLWWLGEKRCSKEFIDGVAGRIQDLRNDIH